MGYLLTKFITEPEIIKEKKLMITTTWLQRFKFIQN
jgi:hypothetical protein